MANKIKKIYAVETKSNVELREWRECAINILFSLCTLRRQNMVCTHCHRISVIVKIDLFIDHSCAQHTIALQCQYVFFLSIRHFSCSFFFVCSLSFCSALDSMRICSFVSCVLARATCFISLFFCPLCVICMPSKCQIEPLLLMVRRNHFKTDYIKCNHFPSVEKICNRRRAWRC